MRPVDLVAAIIDVTGVPRWMPVAGPLIVMYHGLGGPDGVDPMAFEEQLDLLVARRRVVPLAEAVSRLGTPEARTLAAITFDDGYVDFEEFAVPALARRSLHATLFVPSAHVGGANVWDAGRAPTRRILDAGRLRGLDARSVELGLHGATHRRLSTLAAEELHLETLEARARLEDLTGRKLRHFAYPYGQLGDFDLCAERAVEAAGFEAACSTHFGRSSSPGERFRLRRVGIEPRDDHATVRRKLDGAYDWVAWKERVGAWIRRTGGVHRSSSGWRPIPE